MSFLAKKSSNEELSLFPGMSAGGTGLSADEGRLAVDVYETDKDIVAVTTIAGVEPENLEVFVHNDLLTIRGRRQNECEAGDYLVRECHWGAFSRSLILPTEVDAEAIAATLKNGVLSVRMPKIHRSKRIAIKEA
ncbi:Hsp20/alpha crystallin family protein [Candidatus Uhrbacteria bacterium]|nr:Hsp20/alpha crystallin family protein [Candidatus Uhrbacteria bacterium]